MLDTITRAVRDVDERVPVLSVATWQHHLDAGLDVLVYRAGAIVFCAFGGIALLCALAYLKDWSSTLDKKPARMAEDGVGAARKVGPSILTKPPRDQTAA